MKQMNSKIKFLSFLAITTALSFSANAIPVSSLSEVLNADAGEYIKSHRVSLEEAKRRLIIQESKQTLIQSIEEKFKGRLAGVYVEHDPEYKIVVRLKGNQPIANYTSTVKNLTPYSTTLPLTVPVEFQTGAFETKQEGLSRLVAGIASIKKQYPDLQGAWFDEVTGEVVFDIYQKDKSGIQEALSQEATKKTAGLPTKIKFSNLKYTDAASLRGGALISNPTNSADYCTSGFTIKNTAGTRYMTTAAHCSDTLKDNASNVTMTLVGQVKNASKDVQWHSVPTGNTLLPEFYADSQTTARILTGRRTRVSTTAGDEVCHQGRTTGYSCGKVAQTNFAPTYSGACGTQTCSPVWVRVVPSVPTASTLKCYPGDSGGPVFASQTAFGLLKGTLASGKLAGQCTEYYYMSTDEIYNQGFSLQY